MYDYVINNSMKMVTETENKLLKIIWIAVTCKICIKLQYYKQVLFLELHEINFTSKQNSGPRFIMRDLIWNMYKLLS